MDLIWTGRVALDDLREDATGYVGWLDFMRDDGSTDAVDREMLAEWKCLIDSPYVNPVEAASFLRRVMRLVGRIGPRDRSRTRAGENLVERVMRPLELSEILDAFQADPAVVAAIETRRTERRAAPRHERQLRAALPVEASPSLCDQLVNAIAWPARRDC